MSGVCLVLLVLTLIKLVLLFVFLVLLDDFVCTVVAAGSAVESVHLAVFQP